MRAPFTTTGDARAEGRIEADLERIVARLTAVVPPAAFQSLALIGGFARGEGAVIVGSDGLPRGFNDYDLVLLVRLMVDLPNDSEIVNLQIFRAGEKLPPQWQGAPAGAPS